MILDNIPDIFSAPKGWGLAIGIAGGATFLIFAFAGDVDRGKIAAFSLDALLLAAAFCWEFRIQISYWVILVGSSFAHLSFIFLVDWHLGRGPAMRFTPFMALDVLLLAIVIQVVCRVERRIWNRGDSRKNS